ncbi:hypothetical protein DMN91_002005 [Ooceraea biroi]|uniref:Uncharacterized protein n=1 Tax=Ooceraea biroi TaxID=2015173 RepID=A0A3L8DZH2_OOCBI|nr:hypothetical protein DMN91_002005 [Ooceraea biroi]
MRLHLLQCPSCGWEDTKPEKLDINAKKTNKHTKPLDVTVPCSEYTNFVDKSYEEYNVCRRGTVDNIYQRILYTVPCPSFPHNLLSYSNYCSNILTSHTLYPQNAHTNQQTQVAFVVSKPQLCTREIQLSSERLFPENLTKQAETSMQNHDKGMQNTVCVLGSSITPPLCKCATVLRKSRLEVKDVARKCYREVRSKFLEQEEVKEVAVNTVEQRDEQIETCIAFEKATSTTQASERVDTSTVKCPGTDARDVIGIRLNTAEYPKQNFVLITIDGNYIPLKHVDPKLQQLATNECQKYTGELGQDQKEAEKARFTLDDKKLVENETCVTETCSRDTMEIVKHNSAVTQALLQCLEKMIQLQEETSETTICEPCEFADENTNFATTSVIESGGPSCLPCMEDVDGTDVIATLTKTFLELMKHALTLNSKKCIKNAGCTSKEDAIDTFIFLNKMKECADKILKIHMLANCLKEQPLDKRCPRWKGKCPPMSKRNLASSSIQIGISENSTEQFTGTYANSEDVEVLYPHIGPFTLEIADYSSSENHHVTLVETAVEERPSVKDEEVVAHVENHDVGLNASRVLHHDLGTQYSTKQLQDTGVATEQISKAKISVSTQNREPILLRVIKCDNSGGIRKLDKETCVRDGHVAWTRRAEKYMETYPLLRSRLSRNTYRRYLVRASYNEELHPGISHLHEKEVNRIDYHTSSLSSNKNYRCDRQYKSSLPRNLPPFELPANERISRIPLYARSRKYVRRRRADLYGLSQSYA